MRPRFNGNSDPKAEEMVSMSAPGPSLRLFATTHDSSAETLAPSTIVSAQLMGGMPAGCHGSLFHATVIPPCLEDCIAWQILGVMILTLNYSQQPSQQHWQALTILLAAFIDLVLDTPELIHNRLQALVLWAIQLLSAHAGKGWPQRAQRTFRSGLVQQPQSEHCA